MYKDPWKDPWIFKQYNIVFLHTYGNREKFEKSIFLYNTKRFKTFALYNCQISPVSVTWSKWNHWVILNISIGFRWQQETGSLLRNRWILLLLSGAYEVYQTINERYTWLPRFMDFHTCEPDTHLMKKKRKKKNPSLNEIIPLDFKAITLLKQRMHLYSNRFKITKQFWI